MMPASDSIMCEATLSSIGDTSGEKAAPAETLAVPPIQGRRRGISFTATKPPVRSSARQSAFFAFLPTLWPAAAWRLSAA
jgi:hypothetical protein